MSMISLNSNDEFLEYEFADLKHAGDTTTFVLNETSSEDYVLADHVKINVGKIGALVKLWACGDKKKSKLDDTKMIAVTEFRLLHEFAQALLNVAYACAVLCPNTNDESAIEHFEEIMVGMVRYFVRNKILRDHFLDKLHEMDEWNRAIEIFVNKEEAPHELTVQPTFPKTGRTDLASTDLIHVNKRKYPTIRVEVENAGEASELSKHKLYKRVYQAAHKKAEIQKSYVYEYLKDRGIIDEDNQVIVMSASACHKLLQESNDYLDTGKAAAHISLAMIRAIFKETGFKVMTKRGCNGFMKVVKETRIEDTVESSVVRAEENSVVAENDSTPESVEVSDSSSPVAEEEAEVIAPVNKDYITKKDPFLNGAKPVVTRRAHHSHMDDFYAVGKDTVTDFSKASWASADYSKDPLFQAFRKEFLNKCPEAEEDEIKIAWENEQSRRAA